MTRRFARWATACTTKATSPQSMKSTRLTEFAIAEASGRMNPRTAPPRASEAATLLALISANSRWGVKRT
jgi:hypothetical protein